MKQWLGQLLGIEDLESIEQASISFAAPWAEQRPALVLFACLAAAAIALVFYYRFQRIPRRKARVFIAGLRALALVMLVLILAEPSISMSIAQRPRPLLVWLFDGTDSMNMNDKLSGDEAQQLQPLLADDVPQPEDAAPGAGKKKTTPAPPASKEIADATRLQLVQRLLAKEDNKVFEGLENYRVRAYVADRMDQVRELSINPKKASRNVGQKLGEETDTDKPDARHLAAQLSGEGQVTALGAAIADLGRRHRSHLLAGVVVVSDFDNNAGAPPLAAARKLDVPMYTVGLGPREVIDLSVDLQTPLVLKKDEEVSVTVFIRQSGLTGRSAQVKLLQRRLGVLGDDAAGGSSLAAEPKTVTLNQGRLAVSIPFLPKETGRYVLQAKIDSFDDEVLEDNNTAERQINIRDDSLKLLYVEYEPTWEWRFVKEVFHRDPLIGREGFRTFLRSADFKVRRNNELFLETLVRPRSEFFAYDVIFLSDVPREMLPEHFQKMLREYVEHFGGGLVVVGGPRFGLRELAGTELADMLPIVIDQNARPRPGLFRPQLTPDAARQDFMTLGDDENENRKAWRNLGKLHWYQPVARPHPLATVLMQHPNDKCVDQQTPQPLIATRRFGKGEVVYLGFNETWRLRKRYGEKYYRQFWGQMIYRLGLGRALGSQKRFQVYTDRPSYQAGDKVRVTIEAYDQDFNPLELDQLTGRLVSSEEGGETVTTDVTVPLSRDKVVFETFVPVYAAGSHSILMRDPVTQQDVAVNFKVAPVTAERRNAVRDFELQRALATQTGGKHYELHEISQIGKDLADPEQIKEITERRLPLWNTWAVVVTLLSLLLVEWLSRKLVNLR